MKYKITGTRAYGPERDDSDLDIVLRYDDAHDLNVWLQTKGIEVWETDEQLRKDYGGFYFDLMGIKINIIEARTDKEMHKWDKRTEEMKMIEPIEDREERIKIFNEFEV
jgi:hypothetical protein